MGYCLTPTFRRPTWFYFMKTSTGKHLKRICPVWHTWALMSTRLSGVRIILNEFQHRIGTNVLCRSQSVFTKFYFVQLSSHTQKYHLNTIGLSPYLTNSCVSLPVSILIHKVRHFFAQVHVISDTSNRTNRLWGQFGRFCKPVSDFRKQMVQTFSSSKPVLRNKWKVWKTGFKPNSVCCKQTRP